jgi:peptidoglycan L-alanyl-D-glutamate endopeptidase CwlK
VRDRCRRLIALCEGRGIGIIVTSTLRTEAEQLALFAQGRKVLKTVNEFRAEAGLPPIGSEQNRVVTRAATSVHQFGLAFDVAILKPNSRMAEWSPKADLNDNDTADYEEVGLFGESLGLQWGGRFRLRDYCHFQFTGGLSLRELMAGQRPETDPEDRPDNQALSAYIRKWWWS